MAKATHRSVDELKQEEFEELRVAYFYSLQDSGVNKYETADEIPDDEVKKNYEGISFVEEDFWCNLK